MSGRQSANPPEFIDFTVDDRRPVLTVMRRLRHERDGWINLQPAVEPEDVPDPGTALGRLFSARGGDVPLGSWVPGARKRNGEVEPVSLGLQHGSGPKGVRQLRDAGHPVPAAWKVLADHPRRGIVLAVPDAVDPDETLQWLLRAAVLLTRFELPPAWFAGVFAAR